MEAKHIKEMTVGAEMRLARLVANKDTWPRLHTNTETREHQGNDKGWVKVQAEAKARQRIEHQQHACVVERMGSRNQIVESRLPHDQTAEKLVT